MKIKITLIRVSITLLLLVILLSVESCQEVKSPCSCPSTHTSYEEEDIKIIVPNVITPWQTPPLIYNYFAPRVTSNFTIEKYRLIIMDGNESVFESNSINDVWFGDIDGEIYEGCKVFNYSLEITFDNEKSFYFDNKVLFIYGDYCPENQQNCYFIDQIDYGSDISQHPKASC